MKLTSILKSIFEADGGTIVLGETLLSGVTIENTEEGVFMSTEGSIITNNTVEIITTTEFPRPGMTIDASLMSTVEYDSYVWSIDNVDVVITDGDSPQTKKLSFSAVGISILTLTIVKDEIEKTIQKQYTCTNDVFGNVSISSIDKIQTDDNVHITINSNSIATTYAYEVTGGTIVSEDGNTMVVFPDILESELVVSVDMEKYGFENFSLSKNIPIDTYISSEVYVETPQILSLPDFLLDQGESIITTAYQSIDNPSTVKYELSDTVNFSNIVSSLELQYSDEFAIDQSNLIDDGIYYVRVKHKSVNGNYSFWSPYVEFAFKPAEIPSSAITHYWAMNEYDPIDYVGNVHLYGHIPHLSPDGIFDNYSVIYGVTHYEGGSANYDVDNGFSIAIRAKIDISSSEESSRLIDIGDGESAGNIYIAVKPPSEEDVDFLIAIRPEGSDEFYAAYGKSVIDNEFATYWLEYDGIELRIYVEADESETIVNTGNPSQLFSGSRSTLLVGKSHWSEHGDIVADIEEIAIFEKVFTRIEKLAWINKTKRPYPDTKTVVSRSLIDRPYVLETKNSFISVGKYFGEYEKASLEVEGFTPTDILFNSPVVSKATSDLNILIDDAVSDATLKVRTRFSDVRGNRSFWSPFEEIDVFVKTTDTKDIFNDGSCITLVPLKDGMLAVDPLPGVTTSSNNLSFESTDIGSAGLFSGTDSYLKLEGLDNMSEFTISMFVKYDDSKTSNFPGLIGQINTPIKSLRLSHDNSDYPLLNTDSIDHSLSTINSSTYEGSWALWVMSMKDGVYTIDINNGEQTASISGSDFYTDAIVFGAQLETGEGIIGNIKQIRVFNKEVSSIEKAKLIIEKDFF